MLKSVAKTELDRALALDIVRVTEASAVSAALWRGRGNEVAADEAAATAMYRELASLPIQGVVVVGEGEENETPLLYIGETVGAGGPSGHRVDLAVDPVEGSTLCAKALPNALSVMALAEGGTLLKVPTDLYGQDRHRPGLPRRPGRSRRDPRRQSQGAWHSPRVSRSPRSPSASSIGRATPG